VELHHVGLEAPVLTVGEVRGQDAQRVARVLGLVVETGGEDAKLLEHAVDSQYVGDREGEDAESRQGLRDGEQLVEPARRRNVAKTQGGYGDPAEVQRFYKGWFEARNGEGEVPTLHAGVVDHSVAHGDQQDPDDYSDRDH
jgi:hypothetical protein